MLFLIDYRFNCQNTIKSILATSGVKETLYLHGTYIYNVLKVDTLLNVLLCCKPYQLFVFAADTKN